LGRLDLVTEVILAEDSQYWLAEAADGELVGVVGVEFGNEPHVALLRSAAVHPNFQRHGIGKALIDELIGFCRAKGVRRLYCFSTDKQAYWGHIGFEPVSVAELVAALPTAYQVSLFERLGWLSTELAWCKLI
jgi:N-acetylglutamate synthase-like GNAT family acetyltransferase